MLRRGAVLLVVLVTVVAGAWIQQAISEEGPPPPPPPGQRDPAQWQQRVEQFRQQIADRMKQDLGVTDDEWKVLQPKIEKVTTLARDARFGGMRSMFGRRGGPPREGGGDRPQSDRPQSDRPSSDRPQSEMEKKGETLQKLLDNKEAKAEEIKTALAALRETRAKARADLETAQKELREVLTLRQEAQLVMMGLLD